MTVFVLWNLLHIADIRIAFVERKKFPNIFWGEGVNP